VDSALVLHPHHRLTAAPRWLSGMLPALLLLGIGARLLVLAHSDLHPDEALYAGWALRIADGSDPALLHVAVDKPPWLPYLLAGLFRLLGYPHTGPFDPAWLALAGRLAAVVASSLSLILFWLIARRLHDTRTATLALALMALSPLAVRLSATLFTDPWLLLWLLLAWWAALARRNWLAGVACGLAYATKQQAVLFLPALTGLIWWQSSHPYAGRTNADENEQARSKPNPSDFQISGPGAARQRWQALQGFLLVAVLVLWWDSLRWQWLPSYWQRSAATYGGLHWALDASFWPRLGQWAELIGLALGWPVWLIAAALLLRQRTRPAWQRTDAILLLVALGYLLLHLFTTLAPWDRYALPLVPLLALPIARLLAAADSSPRRVLPVLLGAALLVNGMMGASARLPLADAGLYRGVAQSAAWLRQQPADTVVYQHRLGWHYSFYLYRTPVKLRWWATPADLATAVAASSPAPALVAFAAGDDIAAAAAALQDRGFALLPTFANDQSAATSHQAASLYRIVPAAAAAPTHAR